MTKVAATGASPFDGFEIVASDSLPSISLDNQRRFYINVSARRLMDVKPYERLALGYRTTDNSLAVYRGDAASAHPTSNYTVDKRYYLSARNFANHYGFEPNEAPFHFVYEVAKSDGSTFVFKLIAE